MPWKLRNLHGLFGALLLASWGAGAEPGAMSKASGTRTPAARKRRPDVQEHVLNPPKSTRVKVKTDVEGR